MTDTITIQPSDDPPPSKANRTVPRPLRRRRHLLLRRWRGSRASGDRQAQAEMADHDRRRRGLSRFWDRGTTQAACTVA